MKKNYFLIVCLALMGFVPSMVKGAVTINVDDASRVIIKTEAGYGRTLELVNGDNSCELSDSEQPLLISAAENCGIVSVKVGSIEKDPTGEGVYRLGFSDGMTISVTTKSLSANKTVTFSIDNPTYVTVKNGDEVLDTSSPVEVPAGTSLTVSAASENYKLVSVTADGHSIGVDDKGEAIVRVDNDMTVYVVTKLTVPAVVFNVDYPNRVTVLNAKTDTPIDISVAQVELAKGTPLTISASDAKYSITSVAVNGETIMVSGDGAYHTGVTGNMTIDIKTASTSPAVRFDVNMPDKVRVRIEGQESALDLSKTHEVDMNAQLIIEIADEAFRIVSVQINGMKLPTAGDGKYRTSVTADMTIAINVKSIMPVLTFDADAPERLKVTCEGAELNITDFVEMAKDKEIIIAPSAANFSILSVKVDGVAVNADDDGSYHFTVTGDMSIEIKTQAELTLHIAIPTGGSLSVYLGETQLADGDKVLTGEELTFKNTFDVGYAFLSYFVNGIICKGNTYVVAGSQDITVMATFKQIPDNHAMVTFDIDNPLVNVWDKGVPIDKEEPYEIEKGRELHVFTTTNGLIIKSCMVNGEAIACNENNPNAFDIIVNENIVIKVLSEQLVNVVSTHTSDESGFNRIGTVMMKYNDKEGDSFYVRVGETVELIAVPADGYVCDFFYRNSERIDTNVYTVTEEDQKDNSALVVFKGSFSKGGSGIENTQANQSYFDAETATIMTNGGETRVYTLSGETVISTTDTVIPVFDLAEGIYIVKAQDKIFKLIKK